VNDSDPKSLLAQFLVKKRAKYKLKRSEVANGLGLNLETVRLWEIGRNGIPIEKIQSVCEAYRLKDEEKEELERIILGQKMPETFALAFRVDSTEAEVFSAWVKLPEESRKKILKAMNAYESPS